MSTVSSSLGSQPPLGVSSPSDCPVALLVLHPPRRVQVHRVQAEHQDERLRRPRQGRAHRRGGNTEDWGVHQAHKGVVVKVKDVLQKVCSQSGCDESWTALPIQSSVSVLTCVNTWSLVVNVIEILYNVDAQLLAHVVLGGVEPVSTWPRPVSALWNLSLTTVRWATPVGSVRKRVRRPSGRWRRTRVPAPHQGLPVPLVNVREGPRPGRDRLQVGRAAAPLGQDHRLLHLRRQV